MTFVPARILTPGDNGTSCIMLPLIIWPGRDLADEIVEFKRTGNMVPGGMAGLLFEASSASIATAWTSADEPTNEEPVSRSGLRFRELAGCAKTDRHKSTARNKETVRAKT